MVKMRDLGIEVDVFAIARSRVPTPGSRCILEKKKKTISRFPASGKFVGVK